MNKVINIGQSYYDDDYKLRLIAYNIVEYICNTYDDIQVSSVLMSDEFASYIEVVNYKYLRTTLKYLPDMDFIMDDPQSEIKGLDKFFATYNIPEEHYLICRYIFIILHELGHTKSHIKNSGNMDMFERYFASINAIQAVLFLTYGQDRASYNLQSTELSADIFAYNNFYQTYIILMNRGLIF